MSDTTDIDNNKGERDLSIVGRASTPDSIIPNKIQLLPEHLIDQIKAGEVIERPSSVVKELVENSIDAGATRISISLRDSGLELISVEDNGQGMEFSDIPYAFCRHATSKIERFDDIYRLHTFGFRGEALASVASIARVECVSCPAGNPDRGGRLKMAGGQQEELVPFSGRKGGTHISVSDLFYNTPVRLKFVKSHISEKRSLRKILHAFIIANPHIKFEIKWDDQDKIIFDVASKNNYNYKVKVKERVAQVFFRNKKSNNKIILDFEHQYEGYKVEGFVSAACSKGHSGKVCYFFINGRLFYDRSLHQLVHKKMERLWQVGQFGHYVMSLHIPPDEIDVNVHPNKTQVHFFQMAKVFAVVSAGIDSMFNNQAQSPANKELPPTDITKDGHTYQPPVDEWTEEVSEADSERINLTELTSCFYLYTLDDNFFLLNGHRLILKFLSHNIRVSSGNSEGSIPLLISEPFNDQLAPDKSSEQERLEFFNKLGLEFDRIDGKTLALRTMPKWCEGVDLSIVIQPLLDCANSESISDMGTFLEKLSKVEVDFRGRGALATLEHIMGVLPHKDLLQERVTTNLSDQKLATLF